MPWGLKRHQQARNLHFITFSCYQRKPYLDSPAARSLFLVVLERMRLRYDFSVAGYVVMPEHVHLLLSEPAEQTLAAALHAVKLSVAKQLQQRPFWQPRYYDFNVFTEHKRIEKLKYMHRNPVRRGLVAKPEDWLWSTFSHYLSGREETVEIDSGWTSTRSSQRTIPC
jgi:putative transposase